VRQRDVEMRVLKEGLGDNNGKNVIRCPKDSIGETQEIRRELKKQREGFVRKRYRALYSHRGHREHREIN
jgi:hypothetical protein